MAYSSRGTNPSDAMNLDVNEIASILRQVQSGQLSLQQQQLAQRNGQNPGPININTNYPIQGSRTGQFEDDRGLSLLQQTSNIETQSNFGLFSQSMALRRPGRSQTGTTQDDTTLSKSAIQKQIFATRMLGTPAVKLAGQTGLTSNIKPNLAASRTGLGSKGTGPASSSQLIGGSNVRQQQYVGLPNVSPPSAGLLGAAPRHGRPTPDVMSSQGPGTTPGRKNRTPNFSSTSQGRNSSSSGGANFSNQSKTNFSNAAPLQGKAGSNPIGFSQDVDLRHIDVNQKSTTFPNTTPAVMMTQLGRTTSSLFATTTTQFTGVPPPSMMSSGSMGPIYPNIPPPPLGGNSTSPIFPSASPNSYGSGASPNSFGGGSPFTGVPPPSSSGISTASTFSGLHPPSMAGRSTLTPQIGIPPPGIPPPSSGVGFSGVSQPPIGGRSFSSVPPPSSGGSFSSVPPPSGKGAFPPGSGSSGSYSSWQNQGSRGDEARKRKLHDELAEFESQVGPSKQRKSSTNQNKIKPHQGGAKKSTRWSPPDVNASPASDANQSREQSPYQWSTNFVHEDERGEGEYEEVNVEGWIDSLVTYKKAEEVVTDLLEKKRGSSQERDRSGRGRRRSTSPRSSRRDQGGRRAPSRERARRGRSAERNRPRSPLRRRSPARSKQDAGTRRQSLSPLGLEKSKKVPPSARNQFGERGMGRNQFVKKDAKDKRSPVGNRRNKSPRNAQDIKSPNQLNRDARSPRRGRGANLSPRREERGRSDQRSAERGDTRAKQGRDPDHVRSGREGSKDSTFKGKPSEPEKSSETMTNTQSNQATGGASKDEKSGRGSYRPIIRPEEKKSIKINLAWTYKKHDGKGDADHGSRSAGSNRSNNEKDGAKRTQTNVDEDEDHLTKMVGSGSSVHHQISLFTKLDMGYNIKNKQLVECFCYLCQMSCDSLQAYLKHTMDKKHKDNIVKAMTSSGKPLFIRYLQTLPEAADTGTSSQADGGQTSGTTQDGGRNRKRCRECDQPFKGPYKVHEKTDEHKKAMESFPHCSICDVRFKDNKLLASHFFAPSHMTKEKAKKKQDLEKEKEKMLKAAQQNDDAVPIDTSDVIGMELIIPVFGYFCRACTKFYNNEKITRREHSVDPDHLAKVKLYYDKQNQDSLVTKALCDEEEQVDKDQQHEETEKTDTSAKDDDMETEQEHTASESVPATAAPEVVDLTTGDTDDVVEIETNAEEMNDIETLENYDGKCARNRVYIRKTVKIDTSTIKTTSGLAKTAKSGPVISDTENQSQDSVEKAENEKSKSADPKNDGETGSKGVSSEESKSKNNTGGGQSSSANSQKSEVKGDIQSSQGKSDSFKSKMIEDDLSKSQNKDSLSKSDIKSHSTKAQSNNDSSKKETPKAPQEDSRSTSSRENRSSRNSEKRDEDKDSKRSSSNSRDTGSRGSNSDRSTSRGKEASSRNSRERSKGRSPSRGNETRSGSSRERSNGRSSSRGKESSSRNSRERSKGRSPSRGNETRSGSSRDDSNERNLSRGNEPGSISSRERSEGQNSSRSKELDERSSRERSNGRSSSRGRGAPSGNRRDRLERRRTPQRRDRREDRSRSRSETLKRSGDTSFKSGESRSSDTDKTKESDVPSSMDASMDELVAIDEVKGSPVEGFPDGEEQDGDEEDGFDEEAMQAMMGNMGEEWQVMSETEDTEESQKDE